MRANGEFLLVLLLFLFDISDLHGLEHRFTLSIEEGPDRPCLVGVLGEELLFWSLHSGDFLGAVFLDVEHGLVTFANTNAEVLKFVLRSFLRPAAPDLGCPTLRKELISVRPLVIM